MWEQEWVAVMIQSNHMTTVPALDSTLHTNSGKLQSDLSQVCTLCFGLYLDSVLCYFGLYGLYTRLLPYTSPWLETIGTMPCIHGNILYHVHGPNYA